MSVQFVTYAVQHLLLLIFWDLKMALCEGRNMSFA
jgi:hypothetical protein